MTPYTQDNIQQLHLQFRQLRRYADKVLFFDAHFDIIPFEFPDLSTDLHAFFSDRNLERLTHILNIERKNMYSWERVFTFDDASYVFSIKPTNQNHILLKLFILNKFLERGPKGEELMKKLVRFSDLKGKACKEILDISRNMIIYYRYKMRNDLEKNFNAQFITVFLKGMSDCMTDVGGHAVAKKRKFIELFLYAQGILYGRYMQALEMRAGVMLSATGF